MPVHWRPRCACSAIRRLTESSDEGKCSLFTSCSSTTTKTKLGDVYVLNTTHCAHCGNGTWGGEACGVYTLENDVTISSTIETDESCALQIDGPASGDRPIISGGSIYQIFNVNFELSVTRIELAEGTAVLWPNTRLTRRHERCAVAAPLPLTVGLWRQPPVLHVSTTERSFRNRDCSPSCSHPIDFAIAAVGGVLQTKGGAVHVEAGAVAQISDCVFRENNATVPEACNNGRLHSKPLQRHMR